MSLKAKQNGAGWAMGSHKKPRFLMTPFAISAGGYRPLDPCQDKEAVGVDYRDHVRCFNGHRK